MTNIKRFREMMMILGEIHDRKITGLILDIYWKVLEPFHDDQCLQAFSTLLKTMKFFPKPAEFLELLEARKEDEATAAWMVVVNAVRRIGNYQSVAFPDPVTHSAIEAMGGRVNLGLVEEKDLTWKRREFERLYQVLARNGHNGHPRYLPGIHELQNGARGYERQLRSGRLPGHGK